MRSLPTTKGPFAPGCIDIMVEYCHSGIFARLYYPTKEKYHEITPFKWIPDEHYLVGAGKALLYIPILSRIIYYYKASKVLAPVLYGAKVNKDHKLPCVVLSHGYSANRLFYSIISSELASHGYLVAVIEHRDFTTGYTYFYNSKEDAAADIKTVIQPKIILFDENFYAERNKQVKYRANECSQLLDLLIDLNNGKVPHNVLKDLNHEKDVNFNWEDFAGLLDLSTLTMGGHSFGGATALSVLASRKEFKQGLLMDPWMFPIKHDTSIRENVTQPLIFINSETFHTADSVNEMGKYLNSDKRQIYTILHTTHEIQADVGLILGFWMNLFKRKLDPHQAAHINNALILRFLKSHTGNHHNIDDYEVCLEKEAANIASGLTKPWSTSPY